MTSDVEERIHRVLKSHPPERTDDGYRLLHAGGAGIGSLRFLPAIERRDGPQAVAIAEVVADFGVSDFPPFHPTGVQRLNAMAVFGAYHLNGRRLRQTARYSIYANDPDPHLAAQSILHAFGGQLPIGRSVAMGTISAAALEEQRAHHRLPRQWQTPLNEDALKTATSVMQAQGLAASNSATAVWSELALSGDCPSRTIDPAAETAVLQVSVDTPHPIAGAGYLAAITLPPAEKQVNPTAICAKLNALEWDEVGFAPRNGAWGLHGPDDLIGYRCFMPSAVAYEGLHTSLLLFMALRAAWIRDRYWLVRQGITLESLANLKAQSRLTRD